MSKDWYQDIKNFHTKFGAYVGSEPQIPPLPVIVLKSTLIWEEITETLNAIANDNLEGIADGIADSIVVLLGAAVSYGIDIRPIWDEVHRTNMLNEGGATRADGKILKPVGWKPPKIRKLLDRQKKDS